MKNFRKYWSMIDLMLRENHFDVCSNERTNKDLLVGCLLILYRNSIGLDWLLVDNRIEIYPPERESINSSLVHQKCIYNHLLLDINQNNGKFDDFMQITISLISMASCFEIHNCDVLVMLFDHIHGIVTFQCQLSFVVMFQSKTSNFDLTTSVIQINEKELKMKWSRITWWISFVSLILHRLEPEIDDWLFHCIYLNVFVDLDQW